MHTMDFIGLVDGYVFVCFLKQLFDLIGWFYDAANGL